VSTPTGGAGNGHDAPSTAVRVEDNTSSRSYDALVDRQIADTIVYERTGGELYAFARVGSPRRCA
jgi:hypothetical protein